METNKLVRKAKLYLALSLAVGLLLLIAGVLMQLLDIHIIENNKAVVGLSFIPLGLALAFGLNIAMMKKNPKGMRPVLVAELDERVVSIKHHADSITFRALRWALTLLFFGYTFAYPSEIFESAGWWIVFGFFFLAFMMQGLVMKHLMDREKGHQED